MHLQMLSGFALFFAETLYGNAAMVGDGTRHSSRACDDAGGRVVAHNVVRGFSVFSSSTQDVDLSITNRHTATLLNTHRQ